MFDLIWKIRKEEVGSKLETTDTGEVFDGAASEEGYDLHFSGK